MGVRCPRALRGLVASLWSAGRGKSPENSPAATADRRPAAKKVRKLPAQEEHPRSRCSSWAGVQVPHGAARDEHRRAGCSSCMMSIRRGGCSSRAAPLRAWAPAQDEHLLPGCMPVCLYACMSVCTYVRTYGGVPLSTIGPLSTPWGAGCWRWAGTYVHT